MSVPTLDQDQDRDLDHRVGRLEEVAKQWDKRFDAVDRSLEELRQEITAARDETNRRIDAARDETNRRIDAARDETNRRIDAAREETNHRIDAVNDRLDKGFRWLIGVQLTWTGLIIAAAVFLFNVLSRGS